MSGKRGLFAGREMTCEHCGWKFKSNLNFESMWTTVEVDGKLIDFCPHCWGIPRYLWPQEVKEKWDNDHKK